MILDRVTPWGSYALVALLSAGSLWACAVEADSGKSSDDDDGSSASANNSGGSAAAGFVGSGGSTSSAGNGGAGAGATNAASSSSVVASSSAAGNGCMYPAGPYGVAQGQTVPETIQWTGTLAGDSGPSTFKLSDFFDCDGTKGIDAILVDTSQYG